MKWIKNNTPLNAFLKLSKAFDTLDHKLFLDKLKYYGIAGVTHKLMESFLTDIIQNIEIEWTKSDQITVKTAVPQL